MFRIDIHPEVHPEPSIHMPTEESAAGKGSRSREAIPASVLANTADLSAALAAGKTSGVLAHLAPAELTAATPPGDPKQYFVKSSPNTSRPQVLYTGNVQTGALKQTSKQVLADGHGGWKLDNGLPGGGQTPSTQSSLNTRTSGSAPSSDAAAAVQRQEAIAKAHAEHQTAQNELSAVREKLKKAEEDLKMIEQTHGQSGNLWSSLKPPEETAFRPASSQERARHELRRPGYPQQWVGIREWMQDNTNWPTGFKPGKERAQAEDAVTKARLQVTAAQKKVDDANQALHKAMGRH
jgi:hypothetical protein